MTSDDCDYGVDHLGPWRLMTVNTEWTTSDQYVLWQWLRSGQPWPWRLGTMITKVDHLGPWRLMTVITEWSNLDHDVWWLWLRRWNTLEHDVWWLWLRRWITLDLDVWWLWLRNAPPRTMTSDDCDCGMDHLGSWRLMAVITEWTTLDHNVWWL